MTTMRPSLPDFLRFELVVVATVVVLGILGSGSSTTNFGVWSVANVQGIELVRPLHDTSHLAIDTLLRHPHATYVDAKTVWSQKIFCYTKPTATTTASTAAAAAAAAGEDQSRTREDILRSVRIRPQSPRKKVPLDQAVAVYETATTFVSRTKQNGGKSRADNTGDEDEDELLVHSEWPNGQTMWGMAAQGGSQRQRSKNNKNNNNDNMDFTVFAKLRNKHSPLYAPDLIPDPDEVARSRTRNRTGADGDVIVSPKRAALVQFGSSDKTMESKHKFGARETYSYRNIASSASVGGSGRWWPRSPLESWLRRIRPSATTTTSGGGDGSRTSVHYTRYGEGPPFYAPGRMCMLELRGRPIRDLDEATPLLKDLLRKDGGPVANFHWTAAATAAPSIQMAWNRKEASTTYRAGDGLPGRTSNARTRRASNTNTQHLLRLDVPEDDGDGEGERGGIGKRLGAWTRRGKQRAEVVWDRLKAATSMESAGS
eukprot:jgi/Psemu1/322944/estExt_fgenesh1_pg.C_490008